MNKRSILRIGSVTISLTWVLATVGNGCSQEMKALNSTGSQNSANSNNGLDLGGALDTPETVTSGTKTVSLVYANEVLNHLASCAGVAKPSDQTLQTYDQKKGAISVYGAASTVTPPMMMAVASIAGEVCNDLINQEIATGQRIFVGINMAANALPSTAAMSDTISRLALSCWQRYDETAERQMILDMVNSSVGNTETMAARKASLMICTSMLSSLDSILN